MNQIYIYKRNSKDGKKEVKLRDDKNVLQLSLLSNGFQLTSVTITPDMIEMLGSIIDEYKVVKKLTNA